MFTTHLQPTTTYHGLFDDIIGASFLVNEVIAFVGRGDKYRMKLLSFTIKKRQDKKQDNDP
jgi:hypothetical protein